MTSPITPPSHQVVTGPVRLSFPKLWKPESKSPQPKPEDELYYQATILVPPDADLKPYLGALRAAMLKRWGKEIPIDTSSRCWPIKPASNKTYAGYEEGWHSMPTSQKADRGRPELYDETMQATMDKELFYPGCWVRAHLAAYTWDNGFGRGLSWRLCGLQFLEDGERLDGRTSSSKVFAPVEVKAARAGTAAGAPPASSSTPATPAGSPFDMLDLPY